MHSNSSEAWEGPRWSGYWRRSWKHRSPLCLASVPQPLQPWRGEGTACRWGQGTPYLCDERVPAIITRSPPSLPLLRTKAKAARSCSKEAVLAHTWTWVVWLAQNYPCREACTSDSRLQLGVLIFCALWYMSVSPKYRARYSKPSSAKKRRQDQGLGQSWLSRMEQEVRTMVPQTDWLVDTQPVGG